MPMAAAKELGTQGIQAVGRAFRILELLAFSEHGLSLSEIARSLDVNKQIAWKLLQTIEDLGYIYKHPTSEQIMLSYRLANLGHRKLVQEDILGQVQPALVQLAKTSGELARLALEENDELLWVRAELGEKWMLNINPNYAPAIHLHTTATGKAWLATKPPAFVEKILTDKPLIRKTEFTITDRNEYFKELERVRKNGWALSWQEAELGIGAVAAAIMVKAFDGTVRSVGTISLSAPSQRMDQKKLEHWGPIVLETCQHLARMWPQML